MAMGLRLWGVIAMVVIILITYLKKYIVLITGILLSLWLIRKIADLFWWGRDEGKW